MSSQFVRPDPAQRIGKHALLVLDAVRRNGRTELDLLLRRSPYQWTGVYYQDRDDQAYVLLHNSSGGLVEGDLAELYVVGQSGTRVLLTTTAATRFYKCENGAITTDSLSIHVGPGALLEYLPDEALPFADARVRRRTSFVLDETAGLFASDVVSAGRIHYGSGEAFAFTSMLSEFKVTVGVTPVYLERTVASGPDEVPALRRLWGGGLHLGVAVAYSQQLPDGIEERVHDALAGMNHLDGAASRMGNLVSIRLISQEVWRIHEAVFAAWSVVRPSLAGKPARRITKP